MAKTKRAVTATGPVAATCFIVAIPLGIVGLFFWLLLAPPGFLLVLAVALR